MTIAELSLLTQSRFVDAVGWIFERSPWVAERACHRGVRRYLGRNRRPAPRYFSPIANSVSKCGAASSQ